MTARFLLAIFAITIISTGAAWKPEVATWDSMPVAGATSQPIGHFEFCKRYQKEVSAHFAAR